MITFAAQLQGYSGNALGDRIIKFKTYEQNNTETSEIINMPQGTEYLIIAIPTMNNEKELNEWRSESKEETIERFRKRMNAIISDLAKINGEDPKEYREKIKKKLVEKGYIKESTKELDISGLAKVISILQEVKYEHSN